MNTGSTKTSRGKLTRLAADNMSTAEEVFKAALLLLVPEDQTQRKAFEKLMPYLYVLRNKGCSWEQLAALLKQCGFNLQASSVRSYYSEMVQINMDVCQERMTEQLLMLKEIRKETKGADISLIAGKVSTLMDRQRNAAGAKIDAVFGLSTPSFQDAESQNFVRASGPASPAFVKTTAPATPASNEREPASPAEVKPREPASPALAPPQTNRLATQAEQLERGEDESEAFSLLGVTSLAHAKGSNSPTFFDLDDAPKIPRIEALEPRTSPGDAKEAKDEEETWTCLVLQPGVKPIPKKPQVPPAVYEEGLLEHPAMPGFMLTRDQRLYGANLEFRNEDSEVRTETMMEKRLRVMWTKPATPTPTMTSKNFTKMDSTLFAKPKA